jgi:hypothetical protein
VNWKARFKGDYISAVELADRMTTLTIASVQTCKLEQEDGRQKDKGVIWFKEIKRGWVYCKTTGFCLAAMFGEDDDKWSGHRVTLKSEMVQVGKEKQPGIRVAGSPELEKPIKVSIKLPKKKAFIVMLTKSGKDSGVLPDDTPVDSDLPEMKMHGPSCPANIGEACDCGAEEMNGSDA